MSLASQENAGVGEREREWGLSPGFRCAAESEQELGGAWPGGGGRRLGSFRAEAAGVGLAGARGECGGRGSRRLKGRLEVLPGELEGGPGVLGTLLKELGTVSPLVPHGPPDGKRRSEGGSVTLPKGDLVPAAALRVEGRSAGFS